MSKALLIMAHGSRSDTANDEFRALVETVAQSAHEAGETRESTWARISLPRWKMPDNVFPISPLSCWIILVMPTVWRVWYSNISGSRTSGHGHGRHGIRQRD